MATRPLIVLGSANGDIYVEIDRPPQLGETISGGGGQTRCGGKGANQAAAAGRLGTNTIFLGQVGRDGNGDTVRKALSESNVNVEYMRIRNDPTGTAIIFLQKNGENSIIIIGAANMAWDAQFPAEFVDIIKGAGVLLLQREIPEFVNIAAAKVARDAGVTVVLDAGGNDDTISPQLLALVNIFSPNETELSRIVGSSIDDDLEDLVAAARTLQKRSGVENILLKLGVRGSLWVPVNGDVLEQPAVLAPTVVDTTGAGDCFTAAFCVGLLERESIQKSMQFAACAASLCVRVKGALESMPTRAATEELAKQQ
eukprot:GILK01003211.1.p1 GENE.GILK01003211.1~~GILK01003211.1.p1  ORF type:complete len:323 (-),score=71.88 GILK01003211.1:309-1244(-)